MDTAKRKTNKRRVRRASRSRAKVQGTAARPRLSVFRSNKYIYCQLIDDSEGKTLVFASSKELAHEGKSKKIERALKTGLLLAEKAKKAGINKVVFHKGHYQYHGRVAAIAEGARKGGLLL